MSTTREQAIHERRRILQNPHAYIEDLEEINELRVARRLYENPHALSGEVEDLDRPIRRFDNLDVGDSEVPTKLRHKKKTAAEIQKLVFDLHAQIWAHRTDLYSDAETRSPVDMLSPIVALQLIGYQVEVGGALGQIAASERQASNIAGLIDKTSRHVVLSSGFSGAERNFTAAHELGHAVMHNFPGMHRDKPIDGSSLNRDPIEREADIFATLFLMPKRLVKSAFIEIFGGSPFFLDEARRFALSGSIPSAEWKPKNLRQLSRLLSATTRFNGMSLVPLASRFCVSTEAMAIRLEQLELVSFK